MAANDLTDLATVKAWLKIPTLATTDDALLGKLITSASAFLLSTLDRSFTLESVTEQRNGKGTAAMMTKDYPVYSVTSVKIGNQLIPQAADSTQPGFLYSDKTIYLNGYCFPRGAQNVQLVYVAGYAAIPAEVSQVAIDLIAKKYKQRDRIGLRSEVLQGQTVFFDLTDINDEIISILKQYRKVVPVT